MNLEQLLGLAEAAMDETVDLLHDLVTIPSVNTSQEDSGGETLVCERLGRTLEAAGVPCDILEAAPGRGNLVARLGNGRHPRLLFMSHTDVVPAEDASLWRFPPFSGTVVDGFVHGRGSADCKGLAAAEAMALVVLARSQVPLAGQLCLAAGADEETGGRLGFGWLAQHHRELLAADYAINEGGGACFQLGERMGYVLNTGEKGRLEATITVHGKGGHAAAPWAATNPAYGLAEVLLRLRQHQPLPDLSHPIFDAARDLLQTESVRLLQADFDSIDERQRGLASALRGAARMTITPTLVRAGVKSNAIPGDASVICDIRTLPGQTSDDVRRELATALAGIDNLEVDLEKTAEPSASPYPTPLSEAIMRATAAAVNRSDLLWLPGITHGFTDSRLVRPLGTVVYNFAPQAPDPESAVAEGVHGRDERLPIESLRTMLRTLVALAWDLLAPRD